MYPDDITMPLRMQMEQLQRQPDTISSLSNVKRTAPQWHLPLYVFVGTIIALRWLSAS
jgi:hypothetical protein